jgi:gamma-glutamyl:cysteine ligase YbdK (ATP-grasp superfamily)
VEVNFGSSPEFSVGIEEEFQPVSDERYELVSRGRRGRRSPRSVDDVEPAARRLGCARELANVETLVER